MKPRYDELSRYVRFGAEDLENLAVFHTVGSKHFERISRDFYERIREHKDAHAVLSGEEQILRLQRSLVRWMGRVCLGDRDDAYVEETKKIGLVHVRINLPQKYVFSAMALIHIAFDEIADAELGERARSVRASIVRALDLELAIMLETYYDDYAQRLRRVAERALASSEHLFENAVELAPYLVVGIDREGNIALFNRAAERTSQHDRDQVVGRPFIETLFPEGTETAEIVATIAGARPQLALPGAAMRTLSGRLRIVDWQIAHAPSSEENVTAFAVGRDVTDEAASAERRRQQEKLAAVGMLAAGLAHEIRNPLNGAHLHVTFLERGLRKAGANEEALEAVKVVGDEIKRLSTLVTEFLDFARPKPLERRPGVVQRLCEKIESLVAPTLESSKLVLDLPSADLVIDVDFAKIEQVLLNLVFNALEAMAPRGGRAVLRVRRQPLAATIEVEDEGPGLPEPQAPVFDAFYTTKADGTGLGLAIVHRIVTDHGGTVTVESRPGRTIFRVTLPLANG